MIRHALSAACFGLAVALAPTAPTAHAADPAQRAAEQPRPSPEQKNAFVRARLVDAILLMDRHFRVAETGQYLDAIRIGRDDHSGLPSSIAATGIGLVSLALGDALGIIPDAEDKAKVTLRNLLSIDEASGFRIPRSRGGWYPHFIDARTGEPVWGSQGKFSTIDTALLAAGAAISARYFNAKSYAEGRGESEIFRLTGRVVGGVRWQTAIEDVERGLIHLVFKGPDEVPLEDIFANPFDEYAILPCIAMRGEQMGGVTGPAHATFFRHYARDKRLPTNDYGGRRVISKPYGAFISHFTHQFALYYCNAFNTQPRYRQQLRDLADADRFHFAPEGPNNDGTWPKNLWGLGAGAEVKFAPDRRIDYIGYGVNALEKNPHGTASPAIMAGFAPLYGPRSARDPLNDLMTLWKRGTCRYEHEGLGFLWRCSAKLPGEKVRLVEAVDFSTWILGLAGRDPAFGLPFFRNFNL